MRRACAGRSGGRADDRAVVRASGRALAALVCEFWQISARLSIEPRLAWVPSKLNRAVAPSRGRAPVPGARLPFSLIESVRSLLSIARPRPRALCALYPPSVSVLGSASAASVSLESQPCRRHRLTPRLAPLRGRTRAVWQSGGRRADGCAVARSGGRADGRSVGLYASSPSSRRRGASACRVRLGLGEAAPDATSPCVQSSGKAHAPAYLPIPSTTKEQPAAGGTRNLTIEFAHGPFARPGTAHSAEVVGLARRDALGGCPGLA